MTFTGSAFGAISSPRCEVKSTSCHDESSYPGFIQPVRSSVAS